MSLWEPTSGAAIKLFSWLISLERRIADKTPFKEIIGRLVVQGQGGN